MIFCTLFIQSDGSVVSIASGPQRYSNNLPEEEIHKNFNGQVILENRITDFMKLTYIPQKFVCMRYVTVCSLLLLS